MKAVYLAAPRQFEIREQAAPAMVGPAEVRLEMIAVGVCGSDMHYYRSGRIGVQVLTEPWVLGHECTAKVIEVGSEVTSLELGVRVAVDPLINCGECSQCLAGRSHTCLSQQFLGCPGQLPGSMLEQLVMPARCCLPVSDQLSDGEAVMAEPLAIALHALGQARKANVSRHPLSNKSSFISDDIAILGAGPVGLCVLAAALRQGAQNAVVCDPLAYRQCMAKNLGATTTASPTDLRATAARVAPAGFDVVFECAGEPTALDQAVDLLKPGGTLVLVGIPEGNRISLDINQIRRKEITLANVRRQNDCAELAIEMLESGQIDLTSVVTHHFPLTRSAEAFELVSQYSDQVGKVLIHFGPEQ